MANKRFLTLGVLCGVAWGALTLRVFYVQVLQSSHYQTLSESQSLRRDVLTPRRGQIFDREGARLVVNVEPTLGGPAAQALRAPRICPNGPLAGQLLGLIGKDGYGQSGLELHLDRELRGTDGWRYVRKDARNRYTPGSSDQIQPPVDGMNVRLTIDLWMQSVTEHALERGVQRTGAKSGVAIVVDPRTGDILALANYPFSDPNALHQDPQNWENQGVGKVYEPGSAFKAFTASALIEERRIKPTDTIDAEGGKWHIAGQLISDTHPLHRISFSDAMAYSSNIVFAKVSTRIRPITFYKYIRSFGFGMKTGVTLPAEESGWLKSVDAWSARSQQTIAFGHEIAVTPLQMAMGFAAIANGGILMRPRIVSAWVDGNGRVVREEPVREVRRVISDSTARVVRTLLRGVVDYGTASAIKHPTIAIAGKTGTAEKIDPNTGKYMPGHFNSSFAGMAPADNPAFVCLVLLDEPTQQKFGGQASAPIFREILDRFSESQKGDLGHFGVWAAGAARDSIPREKPRAASPSLASFKSPVPTSLSSRPERSSEAPREGYANIPPAEAGKGMPDLRNATLRDALLRLRALGVEVEYSGEGRVLEQHPVAGAPLRRGDRCRLTLGWAG